MNKERGEVEIAYSGEKYLLRYSTNSLCELEDQVKMTIPEILAHFTGGANLGLKMLRAVLWAGLLEHHEKDSVTIEMAGKIIDELSSIKVLEAVQTALIASFPEEVEGAKKKITKKGK